MASSGDDVRCEIVKLKEANLLPRDFRLSCDKEDPNNDDSQEDLKACAAELVEEIVCNVKQQLENEGDPSKQCWNDAGELKKWAESNVGCCMPRQRRQSPNSDVDGDDDCLDARQQVLQRGLQLLNEQTEAIVRDVERIRQRVADRMVSEVSCVSDNPKSPPPNQISATAITSDLDQGQPDAGKSFRNDNNETLPKRVSVSINVKSNKAKQKNNKKATVVTVNDDDYDRNKTSNAFVVQSPEPDSDDVEENAETEDGESGSSDVSDEEDDQQRNNSSRATKSSRRRLPLNRNCNAATGLETGCGGYGGCCGGNSVASCSVRDVLDRDMLCQALTACDNDKMPVSESELRTFAGELVDSLYSAVRAKLSAMLDKEYADIDEDLSPFPKDELLAKADEEVRSQVMPVVVEHIVWLMKEERRALGQLDCDMMMVAFAGQFVDTIVTNAVLKTQVDLSGRRAYSRSFVATSSGGSDAGAGVNGVRPILRKPKLKFAGGEEVVQKVWTNNSLDKLPNKNRNASNNCGSVAPSRPTPARCLAATDPTVREIDRSSRSPRRRIDHELRRQIAASQLHGCRTDNDDNHDDDDDGSGLNTAESDCSDVFVCDENELYPSTCFLCSGCWLSKNVCYCATYDDCKQNRRNNNENAGSCDVCSYNVNNDHAHVLDDDEYDFCDGDNGASFATAAAAGDCARSCDDSNSDHRVRQAVVRVARKSLAPVVSDVRREIAKFKAAIGMLPGDFRRSCDQEDTNNDDSQEDRFKARAAQTMKELVCKVQQQLGRERGRNSEDQNQCQTDDSECLKSVKSIGGCRIMRQSTNSDVDGNDDCLDARQQVFQRGLQLLNEQTEAIVCDVQRIRQRVADRIVSAVSCGNKVKVKNNNDRPTDDRTGDVDEERVVTKNAQPSSSHNAGTAVVSEGLHQYLLTTVDHLVSSLGSRYLADRTLDSAADWLSRCRACVDSPHGPSYHGRGVRLQQAYPYVRAGRALLDHIVLDADCLSMVHHTAQRLFHSAITDAVCAVRDIEHDPAHDLDIADVSLIARTGSLWYQAIQTSELLLMKTAIRANFGDFRTLVSLLFCHISKAKAKLSLL